MKPTVKAWWKRLWWLAVALGIVTTADAASSSAESNLTWVDTRGQPLGVVTGRVLSSGNNVVGATVRFDATSKSAITDSQGRFSIVDVPASSGYVITVSAAGYSIKRFPNIAVPSGTKDLGDLQIGIPVNLPVQVRPLVPDVNPLVTTVEQGGTAYRYYQVVGTDGRTLMGDVTVGLRRAGGAVVSQVNNPLIDWADYETGKPDAKGIVRLRLPSGAIGGPGSAAMFEVTLGSQVVQTFSAMVKSREYDQVWKQKTQADVSIKARLNGVQGAVSTELRHKMRDGTPIEETIGWNTLGRIELGKESSKYSDKGTAKFTGTARAGFYIGLEYGPEYTFPVDTVDPDVNLEKIYVAYAPFLKFSSAALSLLPGETPYERLVNRYSGLIPVRRTKTAWAGHVGGFGEVKGGAKVPFSPVSNAEVAIDAELGGEIGGFAGIEDVYGLDGDEQGQGIVFGFEASGDAGLKALVQNIKFNHSSFRGLGISPQGGVSGSVKGRVWTSQTSFNPTRVDLEVSWSWETSKGIDAMGWKGFKLDLGLGEKVETTETLTLDLPSPQFYNQAAGIGEAFGLMRNYTAARLRARPNVITDFIGGIVGNPYQSSQVVAYKRDVYRTQTSEVAVSTEDIKFLKHAFDVGLSAEFERGAESTVESGVLWQVQRLVLESYPGVTASDYPAEGYWRKQDEWMRRGFPQYGALMERVENYVNSVQGGIAVVKDGDQAAYLNIATGVGMTGQWISSTLFGNPASAQSQMRQSIRQNGVKTAAFEPQANQIYGVSGLVDFSSTNGFSGTATLTLSYANADIAGLNEVDLRIYRLGDDGRRWAYIGGTVNTNARSITAAVTNLGTFAIAPPLPAGQLVVEPALIVLPSDGVATTAITVSNLVLNTGEPASQSWLFTVMTTGVEIIGVDESANYPGFQIASTNGVLRFSVRSPTSGSHAKISVASVAGDASGDVALNLVDTTPPSAPAGLAATAGQSRLFLSWQTNAEPDFAGYRVYYRAGVAGPPWDGIALVDGLASPIEAGATNITLRGLALGSNYFAAVTAVDSTGNESAETVVGPLVTIANPPDAPTSATVSFGADATNFLLWALSEDDGYNDRDVVRYDVFRAVFPGGAFVKVGEAPAGVGLFSETNTPTAVGNYLRYAVIAVDTNGLSSAQALANRFLTVGHGVDNDGDGMADNWELSNGLNPQNPADGTADPDQDGLTSVEEFLRGSNPLMFDNLRFGVLQQQAPTGVFHLKVHGEVGRNYSIMVSTNLVNWMLLTNFACTSATMDLADPASPNSPYRFYRLASLLAYAPGTAFTLRAAKSSSSGGVDVTLNGVSGLNYRLDVSTNLVNWSPLTNFVSTNSAMMIPDVSWTNSPQRFFRGVLP